LSLPAAPRTVSSNRPPVSSARAAGVLRLVEDGQADAHAGVCRGVGGGVDPQPARHAVVARTGDEGVVPGAAKDILDIVE
jgi:hypothetical protein